MKSRLLIGSLAALALQCCFPLVSLAKEEAPKIEATVHSNDVNEFLEKFCQKMKWVSPASMVPAEE